MLELDVVHATENVVPVEHRPTQLGKEISELQAPHHVPVRHNVNLEVIGNHGSAIGAQRVVRLAGSGIHGVNAVLQLDVPRECGELLAILATNLVSDCQQLATHSVQLVEVLLANGETGDAHALTGLIEGHLHVCNLL